MDYVGKEHRKRPWITSGRSRGLRRGKATQGDGLRDPEERSLRGDFAPGVLERMVGLSGLDRPFPPINFTTTVGAHVLALFCPLTRGVEGGVADFLLIGCRGPATSRSYETVVFWLEQIRALITCRGPATGRHPLWEGGSGPREPGPEIAPRMPPLFDTRP